MYIYSSDGKFTRNSNNQDDSKDFGWWLTDFTEEQFGWWLSDLLSEETFHVAGFSNQSKVSCKCQNNSNDKKFQNSNIEKNFEPQRTIPFSFYDIPCIKIQLSQLIDENIPYHKLLFDILNISRCSCRLLQNDKSISEVDSGFSRCLIKEEDVSTILEYILSNKWNKIKLCDQERYLTMLALCMEHDSPQSSTQLRNVSKYEQNGEKDFRFLEKYVDKIKQLDEMNLKLLQDARTIQQDIMVDLNTVTCVTKDCSQLYSNTRDTRYLDDLILLLNGEIESISTRSWPFKIRRSDKGSEQRNFVI